MDHFVLYIYTNSLKILTDIINSGDLNEQCKVILRKINEVSESISFILGIRLNLKARCGFHYQDNTALDEQYMTTASLYDQESLSIHANISENDEKITASTTYEQPKKIVLLRSDSDDLESLQDRKKNKRLPKNVVNVLNSWYV